MGLRLVFIMRKDSLLESDDAPSDEPFVETGRAGINRNARVIKDRRLVSSGKVSTR
jgi:hypothetical protein